MSRPAFTRAEDEALATQRSGERDSHVAVTTLQAHVVFARQAEVRGVVDVNRLNSHHIAGDLRTGGQQLKNATPAGVLLSGKLAIELDGLDLIDEYKFLIHRIAATPDLYQSGRPSTRRLELVSAKPLRCGAVAMHYRRGR